MKLNELQRISLPWLTCLLALAPCDLPAEIYKQVLPDGTVSYSNEPLPGAEKINPPLPQVIPAAKPPRDEVESEQSGAATTAYARFDISEPADDQVIWSNERAVSVNIAIDPALKIRQGHRLVILLDGSPATSPGGETRVTLNEVDRGTHTLTAEVRDAPGRVLMQSATITFHLKQHSSLLSPRPAAP